MGTKQEMVPIGSLWDDIEDEQEEKPSQEAPHGPSQSKIRYMPEANKPEAFQRTEVTKVTRTSRAELAKFLDGTKNTEEMPEAELLAQALEKAAEQALKKDLDEYERRHGISSSEELNLPEHSSFDTRESSGFVRNTTPVFVSQEGSSKILMLPDEEETNRGIESGILWSPSSLPIISMQEEFSPEDDFVEVLEQITSEIGDLEVTEEADSVDGSLIEIKDPLDDN